MQQVGFPAMAKPAADGDGRRKIPSVDAVLRTDAGVRAAATVGRPVLKAAVQEVLAETRDRTKGSGRPEAAATGASSSQAGMPDTNTILAEAMARAIRISNGPTPVINATGVVLHTGLGRAPMSEAAAIAAAATAQGYADLEVERGTGERGRRTTRAEAIVSALTGAEDSLVVNNNAAALLLALGALARGKEVLVSRGELIEIGGEFRLPDIMAASGAKLVEVGTTNRTKRSDYKAAMRKRTALILKVHPSNYRVVGFHRAPSVAQLAEVAREAGVPLLHDIGSGLIEHFPGAPTDEPSAVASLGDGADLVCFSGDKLLGGPQAGIVAGRRELVDRMRRDPLARAVRVDKMQVAALGSVLGDYARGTHASLPVWRMLLEPPTAVRTRAELLARKLDGDLEGAHVEPCESVVGGGSVPGAALPSFAVRLKTADAGGFASNLRDGKPSVFCRIEDDAVLFDMRTVADQELDILARAISYAMEIDEGRGED